MHLSNTAEYALRAMACITLRENGKPISSKALSEQTDIPNHYLSKIMRKMVEGGLVLSRKGHGGGFMLARDPADITFEDIVTQAGYKVDPDNCVFGWEKCNALDPCPLHESWAGLKEAFHEWAENKTLADVTSMDDV